MGIFMLLDGKLKPLTLNYEAVVLEMTPVE